MCAGVSFSFVWHLSQHGNCFGLTAQTIFLYFPIEIVSLDQPQLMANSLACVVIKYSGIENCG